MESRLNEFAQLVHVEKDTIKNVFEINKVSTISRFISNV